ncbi:MAG: stage II sporulation protein R [Clostridia bacterium]|nr:stage II sporulation protein R [Clostridia bacterium]
MKHKLPFALFAALLLTLTWAFASEDVSRELSRGIVRMHILANSNSTCDQALKLAVRDRVLAESAGSPSLLTDAEILACCCDEIKKQGYDYPVTIERGEFYFPRKTYDTLTLPAGDYHAVRIIIGSGEGQNWWCVMYPPLCFADAADGTMNEEALQQLSDSVSSETFSLVCESDRINLKPSFKLVELWQKVKARMHQFSNN